MKKSNKKLLRELAEIFHQKKKKILHNYYPLVFKHSLRHNLSDMTIRFIVEMCLKLIFNNIWFKKVNNSLKSNIV